MPHDWKGLLDELAPAYRPVSAIEPILWLEADRMKTLDFNPVTLKNQQDVVKEEIRVNVKNQPYGGFMWIDIGQHAFRKHVRRSRDLQRSHKRCEGVQFRRELGVRRTQGIESIACDQPNPGLDVSDGQLDVLKFVQVPRPVERPRAPDPEQGRRVARSVRKTEPGAAVHPAVKVADGAVVQGRIDTGDRRKTKNPNLAS